MNLDKHTWMVTGPLTADTGGFGQLYEVESEIGAKAVAKAVPKSPGAERELLFGDSVAAGEYKNVIPVLDSGEHDDFWVIVMPRAEKSLAQRLADTEDILELSETLSILNDVATALAQIDGAVVHRDLKPANVLFHEGAWKLADFGISRYTDASTGDNTRKFSFTDAYAAPEQWEYRHATSAADVYAFGVLAYELLAGHRPFLGPSREDFRHQHLKTTAPELKSGPAKLRYLVEECLSKVEELRPKPRQLLSRLESAAKATPRTGARKLAEISYEHVRENVGRQAAANAESERRELHRQKVDTAARYLHGISDVLEQEILDNAPTAVFDNIVGNAAPPFRVRFGHATLEVSRAEAVQGWDGPFEVIACARVSLTLGATQPGWAGRSHSLWYADAKEAGVFGWFELAFIDTVGMGRSRPVEPFACTPYESEYALKNVMGMMQLAWPVTEVDRVEPNEFVDRWLDWFADAAARKLQQPWQKPEKQCEGTWRR